MCLQFVLVAFGQPTKVTDRPETHLDFYMPAFQGTITLSHAEEVYLGYTAPRTAEGEEAFPVQPFIYELFGKKGHDLLS